MGVKKGGVFMIGLIGFGNMGNAFAAGLTEKGLNWGAFEKVPSLAEKVKLQGGLYFDSLEKLAKSCEALILAIKPQDMDDLLKELKESLENQLVISIAAGLSLKYYQSKLNYDSVVRFMPNLAAKVQKASVGVSFSSKLSDKNKDLALKIATSIGEPHLLPEQLQPAITGLSGSGIAFVFQFIQSLALGGVREGIPYPQALNISLETVEAAVIALRDARITPAEMITRVTSPGGTTIEGIHTLESLGFTGIVMDAVNAASERAKELEN
jgi:pyrroline-5-carboxylate reductase